MAKTYTLELTETEITWLRAMVQNPIPTNLTKEQQEQPEDDFSRQNRHSIWLAVNRGLEDSSSKRRIDIKSINVILNYGTDLISITPQQDFPLATYPFKGKLAFEFRAARGTGEQYCLDNFGVQPKVINTED